MISHKHEKNIWKRLILKRRAWIPILIWTLITVSMILYSYLDIKSWLSLIQESWVATADSYQPGSPPPDHTPGNIDSDAIFQRRFFFAIIMFISVWAILCFTTLVAVKQMQIRYELMQRSRKKHVRLEQLLRQSQKMEAVGQLAGGIAHDFNNLLGIIIASAELAKSSSNGNKQCLQYLDDVVAAGDNARELIDQLKIFSGKNKLSIIRLDLYDLVSGFLKLLNRIIGNRVNVSLLPACGSLPVDVDKGQLEQVVMNLCLNARDAILESSREGGEIIISSYSRKINVGDLEDKPWARCGHFHVLEIKDNGSGMDPKTAAKLFDPFFTTKPSGKGTGLGMSIVFTIVKSHEGFILFDTIPGKGTTFQIHLPAAQTLNRDATQEPLEGPPAESRQPVVRRPITILVAEDDDMLRKMICRLLGDAQYKVIQATSGTRALHQFTKHRESVDLLLFDIMMPGMSGIDAYNEIRQIDAKIPVLFSSGYSQQSIPQELMDSGQCDILWKPYRKQELLESIEKMLQCRSCNQSSRLNR